MDVSSKDVEPDTSSTAFLKKCFGHVLSADISKVFNPSILHALLGHAIPSGAIACNETLSLEDFTFPLGAFRDGFFIDPSDQKLKKREGFSIYISKGFADNKFTFSIGSFTANALTDHNSFMTDFVPDK